MKTHSGVLSSGANASVVAPHTTGGNYKDSVESSPRPAQEDTGNTLEKSTEKLSSTEVPLATVCSADEGGESEDTP